MEEDSAGKRQEEAGQRGQHRQTKLALAKAKVMAAQRAMRDLHMVFAKGK